MIPLCEPASAQKTGLEHNVWYLVVQGVNSLISRIRQSVETSHMTVHHHTCTKPVTQTIQEINLPNSIFKAALIFFSVSPWSSDDTPVGDDALPLGMFFRF